MSSFKHKPSKLKYLSEVTTLDEIHKGYVSEFQENKKTLPQKRKKLKDLHKELENNTGLDLSEKSKIMSTIDNLEIDIKNIEGDSQSLEYISKAGDLLINYYNITASVYYNSDGLTDTFDDNTDTNINTETEIDVNSTSKKKQQDRPDKLKELNNMSKINRKVKKPVKKRRIVQNTTVSRSILQFLPVQESQQEIEEKEKNSELILNRATLQHKFLMVVNPGYACGKVKANKIVCCENCGTEMMLIQSEGCYVCVKCGVSENIIMESELPSHRELANEKQKYPYKKINHLKEKLNQFQSKESADVPDEICNRVIADLRKRKISPQKCTPLIIRRILKKHKLTDWYEHLQQIYCKISGNPPITLSSDIEETIITMFQAMQESFRKHCPSTRSNFLSYSYVLNKLFKILQMPEHSKYFGLLKSKEKLREQDIIWAKICRDLGWKFYSSF